MTMRNSNNKEPKHFGVKALVLTGAATLALTATVGGTLAWLIAEDTVTNTFTYGDINIELTETDTGLDADDNDKTNEYEMVPGNFIDKDPTVIVEADSEDCYLFVQLEKSENFDDFMGYDVNPAWKPLIVDGEEVENVFYYTALKSEEDQEINVLLENMIKVKDNVTKEMLNELTDATYPTLTVKAYGVQYDADIDAIDTVEEAWALTQE
jgi:hypothetical protein